MTEIYQKAYTSRYSSELGDILLAADEIGLTGLWFFGQSYFADTLPAEQVAQETPILAQAREWLDEYFSGKEPGFVPSFHVSGTPFQLGVWKILQKIPYAKTVTYGEIAKEIAKEKGISRMSAQAVGGAVGSNKIGIIIPCHRVVGANGNLTGYAGGIYNKEALLRLEGVDMSGMYIQQ